MDHVRNAAGRDTTGAGKAKWAFVVFALIAAYFLLTEHRQHLSGLLFYAPYLLLLACPLMHIFMHGGGHHGKDKPRSEAAQDERPRS